MNFKKIAISMFIVSLITLLGCEKEKTNVTGVTLEKSTLTIIVGNSEQLSVTVAPEDAEDKGVLWSSSDATIASVSNGLIEGKSEGTATITVETIDGGFTASCTVTVEAVAINVIGISLGTTVWPAIPGDTKQLNFVIEPVDATDKTVSWESSDDNVATVSSSGSVTAIGTGSATITVTTTDGAKTASCEVSVTAVGTITEIMQKGFLTNSDLKSIDIACDISGIPYIANITDDGSGKGAVQVHKYNGSGTLWDFYSGKNVGITGASAYTPSVAIKNDGTVFVAYQYLDDVNNYKYQQEIVSAYDGSNWVVLGGDDPNVNNCFILGPGYNQGSKTQMAFKEDGTLMIAACHYGDGYVSYFDNNGDWSMFAGDWTSYSGYKLDNDNFWAGNIDLAIHENTPYAYIRTESGDGKCGVLEGPETNGENVQWDWLGGVLAGSGIQATNNFETSLALTSNGEVYTSYLKHVDDHTIFVKHFNTSDESWKTVYSKTYDYNPNEARVVVVNDVLYLAVAKYNGGIEIYKYDSEHETWNYEGETPRIANRFSIDLVAGQNGEFFIAYAIIDDASNHEIGAIKYTPAN